MATIAGMVAKSVHILDEVRSFEAPLKGAPPMPSLQYMKGASARVFGVWPQVFIHRPGDLRIGMAWFDLGDLRRFEMLEESCSPIVVLGGLGEQARR